MHQFVNQSLHGRFNIRKVRVPSGASGIHKHTFKTSATLWGDQVLTVLAECFPQKSSYTVSLNGRPY